MIATVCIFIMRFRMMKMIVVLYVEAHDFCFLSLDNLTNKIEKIGYLPENFA